MTLITLDDIRQAHARLQGVTVRTPLFDAASLNGAAPDGRRLFLKLENLQPIGAFKRRAFPR